MNNLTVLVVCLVLSVCFEYTHSKPASASASPGKELATSRKFHAKIIDYNGLDKATANKLKRALENVYRRQDNINEVAAKFVDAAYKILNSGFTVEPSYSPQDIPPYYAFYIRLSVDNKYFRLWL